MHNINQITAHKFLTNLFANLAKYHVDVNNYFLDHICYRVQTISRYISLRDELILNHQLLSENMINGRPIATFKLEAPILFNDHSIPLLELPSPKPNAAYHEGFEHAEFVINIPFTEFMAKYPKLSFDLNAINKPINPEIRLAFPDGTSVKFHHTSLFEVIAQENSINH